MAATFVASYADANLGTTATSHTGSVTCAANDLLLYMAWTGSGSQVPQAPSGGGLTWTLVKSGNATNTGSNAQALVYAATASSAQTFTLTGTTSTSGEWGFQVQRWSNAAVNNSWGVSNSSTGQLTFTTGVADGALATVISDFNGVGGGSRVFVTASAGAYTETIYHRPSDGGYSAYAGFYADDGLTGSKTVGFSAPTGTLTAIVAVELKAVASGGTATSALQATAAATAGVTGTKTISPPLQATAGATAGVAGSETISPTLQATGAATAAAAGTSSGPSGTGATASATASVVAVVPIVVPPAPVPDPIPPVVVPRRMTVSVYTQDYTARVGQVPDYYSCSVTWQYLGVGVGTLVVGEDDPVAATLLGADENVVPVVVDLNGTRWSGRVMAVNLEREGRAGSGTITATLVDDWAWLQKMLASQNGSSSTLTSMPQYDTRTGPAVSVAADLINAAATRLGVPVRATKPTIDTSPTVTIKARMSVLADLLVEPLRLAGVTMAASIWLPGDPQPDNIGTALTTPTVVFAPKVLADKPWLQWTDTMNNINKLAFQVTHPQSYRAIVGLSGTDAAKVYDTYIDTALRTILGAFGLPEIFSDSTQAALGSESQAAGAQALFPVAGKAAAVFEVPDAQPFSFGTDFVVGDMASIQILGAQWRKVITKVVASDDRTGGLTITPVVGEETPDLTGDGMMVQALHRVARALRTLQAGR